LLKKNNISVNPNRIKVNYKPRYNFIIVNVLFL